MKGIKSLVLVVVGATTFSLAASAMAAMSLPSGWYIAGDFGTSRSGNANYGAGMSSSSKGAGFDMNFGYKFMPYLAAEMGYNNYANTKITSGGTSVGQDSHYSYYFAGKGIMPIVDSGFDLFAKLGIARLHSHVTGNNPNFLASTGLTLNTGSHTITGAFLAAGADYNFTPSLTADLQWSRSKGNSTFGNYDLYAIGIVYMFE